MRTGKFIITILCATLLFTTASLAVNTTLFAKSLKFDPRSDLLPVTLVSSTPLVLCTHPSVPAKSVKDLIALAKANPGKLFYASPGNGTPHHLAMELFKSAAGIDIAAPPGTRVRAGEPIVVLACSDAARARAARALVDEAIVIADEAAAERPLVIDTIRG